MYYITIYLVAQKEWWISKWHGIVSRTMVRLKREYAPYHPRTFYFQYSVSSIIIINRTSSIFWGGSQAACWMVGEWIVFFNLLGLPLDNPTWFAGKCQSTAKVYSWEDHRTKRGLFRCHACIGRCWGGMWSSVCHFCMTGLVFNIPNADDVTQWDTSVATTKS